MVFPKEDDATEGEREGADENRRGRREGERVGAGGYQDRVHWNLRPLRLMSYVRSALQCMIQRMTHRNRWKPGRSSRTVERRVLER